METNETSEKTGVSKKVSRGSSKGGGGTRGKEVAVAEK